MFSSGRRSSEAPPRRPQLGKVTWHNGIIMLWIQLFDEHENVPFTQNHIGR
jgi:hypothetical protein